MEHEIVQDLLPLYHDGVCSEKSREAVEAHLRECPDCRAALAALDAPLPGTEQAAAQDASVVKKLSREWEKGKWKAWLKGAIIAVLVCAALAGTGWVLVDWALVPVANEDYTVDAYQLENGTVGVHWDFKEGKETWYALVWKDTENGRHWYLERPILRSSLFSKHYNRSGDALFAGEDALDMDALYFGLEEGAILLWHEGAAVGLRQATAKEEAMWAPAMTAPRTIG